MKVDGNFFNVLFENSLDGVYFVDLNCEIIQWNKGAQEITGYKSSDVIGKSCSDSILTHINDKGTNLLLF